MNSIELYQPAKIIFGAGKIKQIPADCAEMGYGKILVLYTTPLKKCVEMLSEEFTQKSLSFHLLEYAFGEPTVQYFNDLLYMAKRFSPDCVIGIGGGSVLDTAKLLAALWNSEQNITGVFGKNILKSRRCGLIAVPTTSGTGSEVSPNAILLDESDSEKKGVISPLLVPDCCYIDAELMLGLPPKITAETAMDALSHCIEAFTNRFAHPVVDTYALAGIKLIVSNLQAAYDNGENIAARSALALGSLYGGLCLGPVNTAAVHALSYGLGGRYHISHGLANAMLLPPVMRFNVEYNLQKYNEIARAIGESAAIDGINKIELLAANCGIPQKLSEIGIEKSEIGALADLAMRVTRLLINNPREVTRDDVVKIFEAMM
ncbi:MAG: iron-containing alcohol dehydrogenase [Paludibacter sp.]|jgi:alcohol dehydrogenase class IV|nr:iron-containing alcohol dehydrogenase [Paludibacter sp.]